MLRRIVAALVVLGLLAHAQLYAAHQAMALASTLGAGEGSKSWLCLSDDGNASPASLNALRELRHALGQIASGDDPEKQASPCPVCFGLATGFILPDIAQLFAPASFATPPLAPQAVRISHVSARFFQPPGCGPPTASV